MVITDKQVKQILRHLVMIGKAYDGIVIVDIRGTIRFVNPLWAAMHGYNNTDELVGKHISIFHTKEQMGADVIPFMEEAKHRDQIAGPVEHLRSDGVAFGTRTKMIPARDKEGNAVAFVVFATDTTQNNHGGHYFTDQRIKPIIVANDKLQQEITEQKAKSDSHVREAIADIVAKDKEQFVNIKTETEQAITEQKTQRDEVVKQSVNGKIESKQVVTEPMSQTEEKDKTYNEMIAKNKAETAVIRAKAEERTTTKAELRAERQTSKKNGVYALSQLHQAEQDISEVLVKETPREVSLREVCNIFFRHKWKMISFFLSVIIIVAAGTYLSAEVYRSEAKLLLRLGHENTILDPTAAIGQVIPVIQSRENEINSELEILKSQELIEKVVDSVGVQEILKNPDEKLPVSDSNTGVSRKTRSVLRTVATRLKNLPKLFGAVESLSDNDKAKLRVMKNLRVENLKNSSIISISYEAESPKLAQQVVSKFIALHLEKHIAVHQTLGSRQFFAEQANLLRNKLMQSESELQNFKNDIGISSVAEQQRVVLARISTLKQEIGQAEAALASSVAMVGTLQRTMAEMPKTVVTEETTGFPNFRADEMRKKLFERQLDELKLLTNFTEKSEMVKAIRQEITEAQALLDKEEPNRTQITRGLSKAYEQLQSALLAEQTTISSLQAKIDVQKKQLFDAQAEIKTLNDAEAKITLLTREANIEETNYRKYSENLEQARINYAMESERISNIRVVQAATLPIKAIRPNKLVNLLLGVFLSILGAIILAIFSDHLDHTIKTPQEIEERLQLPALASIPRVRIGRVFPIVKLKRQAKAKSETVERVPVKLEIPAKIRECYEAFRERLLLHSNGHMGSPYVLAVIGCQRHEGVSAVAANLAATVSQHHENGHVLLVDANLKHPCVHKVFNTKLSPGLTDILTNGQNSGDPIQSLPTKNVHILSAGTPNGNLSEAFDSDKFTELLNSMKEHYRFVVVDLPALSEAGLAAQLASLCDGTVLVVEAERLRREVMQRAKVQLVESNANILGVVLNKRRFYIPDWLYRRL